MFGQVRGAFRNGAAPAFALLVGLSTAAAPALAGPGKAKNPQPDQQQITDRPPTTDFKAKVTPAQEAKLHLDLGRAFEAAGNYDGAVAEYATAIEVCKRKHNRKDGPGPDRDMHALAHRRLAGAYDRLGEFRQSEYHYREALKYAPNDAKVWNDAGYSYYLQSRFAEAERSLKMAMKLDRDTARYPINLGLALAASGKSDEAYSVLEKVVGPAAAHANVAYVLAGRGNPDQARMHYQQALRIQPDFQVARTALRRLDRDSRNASAEPTVARLNVARPRGKPVSVVRDDELSQAAYESGLPLPKQPAQQSSNR